MTNKSKQKGTSWESAIVTLLKSWGYDAKRKVLAGSQDEGDIEITNLPFFIIEAKNERKYKLAEWVSEAEKEADNSGVRAGVVWAHRQGKASPSDGYVIMSGQTFMKLLSLIKTLMADSCILER